MEIFYYDVLFNLTVIIYCCFVGTPNKKFILNVFNLWDKFVNEEYFFVFLLLKIKKCTSKIYIKGNCLYFTNQNTIYFQLCKYVVWNIKIYLCFDWMLCFFKGTFQLDLNLIHVFGKKKALHNITNPIINNMMKF